VLLGTMLHDMIATKTREGDQAKSP
jgi:hypothetical protein